MHSALPRFAGAFAGAILVSAAAVAVTAEAAVLPASKFAAVSTKPAATAPSDCQAFLGYFAADLKTTPDQVAAAYQDAIGKSIDAAVQRGDLTAAGAVELKAKLAKSSPCAGEIGHLKGTAERNQRLDVYAAVAGALNLTPDALKAAIKGGSSVPDLASRNGLTQAAFEAAVTASLKAQADGALAAGKTTQAQHDKVVAGLPKLAKSLWSMGVHHSPKPSPPVTKNA